MKVRFSCRATGETIYELSDVDVGKAVSELGRRGAELIVYDSKKYYNDYDSIPDDYLFSYDVMLAEYVIDPSEGSYAPRADQAEISRRDRRQPERRGALSAVAVDARGDTRARSGEAAA